MTIAPNLFIAVVLIQLSQIFAAAGNIPGAWPAHSRQNSASESAPTPSRPTPSTPTTKPNIFENYEKFENEYLTLKNHLKNYVERKISKEKNHYLHYYLSNADSFAPNPLKKLFCVKTKLVLEELRRQHTGKPATFDEVRNTEIATYKGMEQAMDEMYALIDRKIVRCNPKVLKPQLEKFKNNKFILCEHINWCGQLSISGPWTYSDWSSIFQSLMMTEINDPKLPIIFIVPEGGY